MLNFHHLLYDWCANILFTHSYPSKARHFLGALLGARNHEHG